MAYAGARVRQRGSRGTGGERAILGVPARIMVPRIVFAVTVLGLTLFGILMVYSASSIIALNAEDIAADYYGVKQATFALVGAVAAVVLAALDYRSRAYRILLALAWVAVTVLLVLVKFRGASAYGATRWLNIGGYTMQPSEFAKVTVVFTAANLIERYLQDGDMDLMHAAGYGALFVGLPVALILFQPDKGTTGIVGITLIAMAYLAGVPGKWIAGTALALALGALLLVFGDDYSRQRVEIMLHPEEDPLDAGYQLMQGFYAFSRGGLLGTGLGFSHQKYSYLPMPHNDFIFAVIGEELGLVGTVATLVAFGLLCWAGYKVAEQAPDLSGRLIAGGCTTLYLVQLLINVSGVLGIFPLSGKPVPFISYGGSSITACLMLAGLVLSVSMHSELPQTAADRRRQTLRVVDEDDPYGYHHDVGLSRAGEAMPRSARLTGSPARVQGRDAYVTNLRERPSSAPTSDNGVDVRAGRSHLHVVEGGYQPGAAASGRHGRVGLAGQDPADRLRTSDTLVRGRRREERRR